MPSELVSAGRPLAVVLHSRMAVPATYPSAPEMPSTLRHQVPADRHPAAVYLARRGRPRLEETPWRRLAACREGSVDFEST
jgi:hypothetical protein